MDVGELQRWVDRHVKLDLRPFYEAYCAEGGGDLDGFLGYLVATQAIDQSVLKDLYAAAEVETPAATDPAYRGTLLEAWAKAATVDGATHSQGRAASVAKPPAAAEPARFRRILRLGEGAMGTVHVARDVHLRRKVALKTVLPEMAGHPESFGRFLAEMQITAQLEHPNIVPVYALDIGPDGSLGYAMKLVQGRDLEMILDEARRRRDKGEPLGDDLSLEKRLEYFLKVCDAVEYAHEKGIVHRDLKPANVMIGRHNEVYLMDWGIARPIGGGQQALEAGLHLPEQADLSAKDVGRTRIGSAIGTPCYMSPEQAQGKNPELDGRSDQYAMGLILQECVTLRPAVDGASVQEILAKAMLGKRDPIPMGNRPGAAPRELVAVVRKATRPDPKDRYPSVREMADDLRRYLRGEGVGVLREGTLRRAGRWLSKHRMTTLALVLGLALVGASGTIGALLVGQARIDAEHARELRVIQMAAESAIQTQLVDRELSRYEAALSEFVGAAQIVLSKLPASEAAPFFEESFGAKETAPPDLGPSKRYGRDVSVLAPVTVLAPGVAREPPAPLLRSLGLLGPAFRALLLGTSDIAWRALSSGEQRVLIADVGLPAYRASIVLREGLTLWFPGMAGHAPGKLELAEGKRGVVWGAPSVVDGESILPASAALHDEQGAFRGVAVLDVSLSKLLSRPQAPELDYVQSRALVGRDGKIMVEDNKPEGRIPLAPEVVAAIAAGRSGTMVAEVDGRRYQYAYHPLSTLDWYYVASGEVGKVHGSKGNLETSDPRKAPEVVSARPPPPAAPRSAGSVDAAAVEAPDAGAPRKLGPAPKPSTDPSDGLPPNPFDKWKVYERKKKTP